MKLLKCIKDQIISARKDWECDAEEDLQQLLDCYSEAVARIVEQDFLVFDKKRTVYLERAAVALSNNDRAAEIKADVDFDDYSERFTQKRWDKIQKLDDKLIKDILKNVF